MRYAGRCHCSRPAWTCICGQRVCYVPDRARRTARDPIDHAPHVCPPPPIGPVGEERFAPPEPIARPERKRRKAKPRPAPLPEVPL